MLKKANLTSVGRTKIQKIKFLLAKMSEADVRTLLGEVKAAAPEAASSQDKPCKKRDSNVEPCGREHKRIGHPTFFYQCGTAFCLCGLKPQNLEEALAEKNVLSASAGTLVRAWPLEQFLQENDIKGLACAAKELFNQISEYRFRLKESKNIK